MKADRALLAEGTGRVVANEFGTLALDLAVHQCGDASLMHPPFTQPEFPALWVPRLQVGQVHTPDFDRAVRVTPGVICLAIPTLGAQHAHLMSAFSERMADVVDDDPSPTTVVRWVRLGNVQEPQARLRRSVTHGAGWRLCGRMVSVNAIVPRSRRGGIGRETIRSSLKSHAHRRASVT